MVKLVCVALVVAFAAVGCEPDPYADAANNKEFFPKDEGGDKTAAIRCSRFFKIWSEYDKQEQIPHVQALKYSKAFQALYIKMRPEVADIVEAEISRPVPSEVIESFILNKTSSSVRFEEFVDGCKKLAARYPLTQDLDF
ncbi:hypothetical protein MUY21_07430 [Aliiroseovarius sp. S2029]|uniref:hypothetical protein n=1 Tax=Aliiroseovarius sp. S2029 TaxID=2936988 RepID=UPI0020BDE53B|nr:hypothetical protein [Aliiroseovarius sp. S2029]MCK8483863.1 hypothetical protein [Aliiroseovarius sp. S2029]